MDDSPRIRLLSRPGCHLCDEAREIVAAVAADVGAGWSEESVDDDPSLARRYGEQVPVIFVDGWVHDYWQVDPLRLRSALTKP
jgi:glutaredoxin